MWALRGNLSKGCPFLLIPMMKSVGVYSHLLHLLIVLSIKLILLLRNLRPKSKGACSTHRRKLYAQELTQETMGVK
jgi:hypothetical protein